jgi:hypothetical protein
MNGESSTFLDRGQPRASRRPFTTRIARGNALVLVALPPQSLCFVKIGHDRDDMMGLTIGGAQI